MIFVARSSVLASNQRAVAILLIILFSSNSAEIIIASHIAQCSFQTRTKHSCHIYLNYHFLLEIFISHLYTHLQLPISNFAHTYLYFQIYLKLWNKLNLHILMYQQKRDSFQTNRNQVKLKPYVLKIDFKYIFKINLVNFKVKLVN